MDPRLVFLLTAASGLIAWQWPAYRRQVLWGALLTLPLVVANLLFAGGWPSVGFTPRDALERVLTLTIGLAAFGGVLATLYEAIISRWLTSFTSERRHHLLWLSVGLLVGAILIGFGVPVPLAIVLAVLLNTLIAVSIDWRMFWDACLSALGFAIWFIVADMAFGWRVSGDISAILIAPRPFGVTVFGLSPERLAVIGGLGLLIGPIFAGLKRYRWPDHPISNAPAGWKLLMSAICGLGLLAGASWLTVTTIQAPHVSTLTPAYGATDVRHDAQLTIRFSRPIDRESLSVTFVPAMTGTWAFTDPAIAVHAYHTATFTPETTWIAGVTYSGRLTGIESFWGQPSAPVSFKFTIATAPTTVTTLPPNHTQLPAPTNVSVPEPVVAQPTSPSVVTASYHQVELPVKLDYQDQPLSCEAAALKMALAAQGVKVSETQIMKIVGYDRTPHRGRIWGDPNVAFVGNIAGKQNTTGYGVYWNPIAKAARVWRPATVMTNGKLTDLTAALDAERAVVVWGTMGKAYRDDWRTPAGTTILAWKGEHARTLIGYRGTSAKPTSFIINDPIAGRLVWSAATFDANWARFNRSAVVVE